MVTRDMFGRSISKDKKNNTQIMNLSMTSVRVEEKTELSEKGENSSAVGGASTSKGNIRNATNLLHELVYEIISDGEQEKRPQEQIYMRERVSSIKKVGNILDKV